jgi:hypothetical protein
MSKRRAHKREIVWERRPAGRKNPNSIVVKLAAIAERQGIYEFVQPCAAAIGSGCEDLERQVESFQGGLPMTLLGSSCPVLTISTTTAP